MFFSKIVSFPSCGSYTFLVSFIIYIFRLLIPSVWASPVAQLVKNPPAMWETCVRSLGWEDPLGKGKAVHSSILAWRIQWTL